LFYIHEKYEALASLDEMLSTYVFSFQREGLEFSIHTPVFTYDFIDYGLV